MYPIQMEDGDRGIGMGYGEFLETFQSILLAHLEQGRARIFAFIFYDLSHDIVREALKQAHGFNRLHDRTAKDVTLFYLHSEAVGSYGEGFNQRFMKLLGIEEQAEIPCMAFFRVFGDTIEAGAVSHIDVRSADPVLVIAELERYVGEAIDTLNSEGNMSGLLYPKKGILSLLQHLL